METRTIFINTGLGIAPAQFTGRLVNVNDFDKFEGNEDLLKKRINVKFIRYSYSNFSDGLPKLWSTRKGKNTEAIATGVVTRYHRGVNDGYYTYLEVGEGIDPATQYVVVYTSDFTAAVVSREKAKLLEDKYGVSLPDNMIIYPNTNFKFSTLLRSVGISHDDIERYESYLVLDEDELYIDVTDFAYREIPEDNIVISDIETGMEYARMAYKNPEMFSDMLKSIDVRNSMKYLIGMHAVIADKKYDKEYKKMNGFICLIEKYFTCGATLYKHYLNKKNIKEYIDTIEKYTVFKYTKKEKDIIIKELLDIIK